MVHASLEHRHDGLQSVSLKEVSLRRSLEGLLIEPACNKIFFSRVSKVRLLEMLRHALGQVLIVCNGHLMKPRRLLTVLIEAKALGVEEGQGRCLAGRVVNYATHLRDCEDVRFHREELTRFGLRVVEKGLPFMNLVNKLAQTALVDLDVCSILIEVVLEIWHVKDDQILPNALENVQKFYEYCCICCWRS